MTNRRIELEVTGEVGDAIFRDFILVEYINLLAVRQNITVEEATDLFKEKVAERDKYLLRDYAAYQAEIKRQIDGLRIHYSNKPLPTESNTKTPPTVAKKAKGRGAKSSDYVPPKIGDLTPPAFVQAG